MRGWNIGVSPSGPGTKIHVWSDTSDAELIIAEASDELFWY